MFNKWIGVGRLTRDPEFRVINPSFSVLQFTVAIDRGGKSDKTDFVNIEVHGKLADAIQPYLMKGKLVLIEGALHIDTWESNGVRKKSPKIIANTIRLLESRRINDNEEQAEELEGSDLPPF